MTSVMNGQLFLEILEKLHVAVYIADSQGTLIYINQAAARLDHLDQDRDIGRNIADIWNANSFEKLNSPTLDTLETGKVHSYDNLEWHLVDGTYINAITSSYPIVRNGQIAGVFTLAEDIAGLKRHLIKQGAFKRKQHYRLRSEILKNGTEFVLEDIIGNSKAMADTISLARRLSVKKTPVFIYGETGTGKEMFAQGIHNASYYAGGPFVAVNCAAIPETLLESMLFGTVKGAFTGASDREGLFKKAENGTLFLDEINSMPITLQAKLLRAIQEKEIQRLGSGKTQKINCRIISAANKEPHTAIEEGELREDLYYRLAKGVIWLPPLRDRTDDIEELTDYFISKVNEEMDASIVGASETLLQMFQAYKWPGNIRELSNVIESAVVMVAENEIILDVDHIPNFMLKMIYEDHIDRESGKKPLQREPHGPEWKNVTLPTEGNIDEMVDTYEEMLLRSAMESAGGRMVQAAEMLQISRQSLYVKLKKYGIDKNSYMKRTAAKPPK